jgi:serine/threonine protein phosphatase 1
LVVGDIHGCFDEFQDLLDKSGLGRRDTIIAIGDLVDRGPDPGSVLDFFRKRARASSLMGNHEHKHVRIFRGERTPSDGQIATRMQLGEAAYARACAFMSRLPLAMELPHAILAHGYFEPGVALAKQKPAVLLGSARARAEIERRLRRPWFEGYDGKKPLLVGHRDYSQTGKPFVYRDRVFALDTGCCYGRSLSGIVLPDFRLVTVRSRSNHWSRTKKRLAAHRERVQDFGQPVAGLVRL